MEFKVEYKGKTYKAGQKYNFPPHYFIRTIKGFGKMKSDPMNYAVHWEEGDWNSLSWIHDNWTQVNPKEFKVGDRVKIIKHLLGTLETENELAKIISINGNDDYMVLLDRNSHLGSNAVLVADKEYLELIEDEKPKIEAVVKCIVTRSYSNLITKDKYYPVIKIDEDGDIWIKDDHGDMYWFSERCFELFKVGDRFKEKHNNYIVKITEFTLPSHGDNHIIWYTNEKDNSHSWWGIHNFNSLFTKLEDEEKKESESLPVGTRVKIIKEGAFCDYRIGNIGTIVELHQINRIYGAYKVHMDEDDKDYTLWMDICNVEKLEEPNLLPVGTRVKLPQNRIGEIIEIDMNPKITLTYKVKWDDINGFGFSWYNKNDVEKLEDPKPQWQPKFKVGDWVCRSGFNCCYRIISLDCENKAYYISHANGDLVTCYINGDYPTDDNLTIWQPMQDLKLTIADLEDKLAMEKGKIEELTSKLQKIHDNFKDFK